MSAIININDSANSEECRVIQLENHSVNILQDKNRVADAFAKSARTYDTVAGLQREVGENLILKVSEKLVTKKLPDDFYTLDLGSGTGYLSEKITSDWQTKVFSLDIAYGMLAYAKNERPGLQKQNFLCADVENLPVAEKSVDIVFSNFALQWCDDIKSVFKQIEKIIKPGGYFAFSLPVEGTLQELKTSWQAVDQFKHVNDFYEAEYIQNIASNVFSGSGLVDVSFKNHALYYHELKELTKELKILGANQIKTTQGGDNKSASLMGRKKLQSLIAAYDQYRNHKNMLPATYNVAYGLVCIHH